MKQRHQSLAVLTLLALAVAAACWVMTEESPAQARPEATGPTQAEQLRELEERVGRLIVRNAELEVRIEALEQDTSQRAANPWTPLALLRPRRGTR